MAHTLKAKHVYWLMMARDSGIITVHHLIGWSELTYSQARTQLYELQGALIVLPEIARNGLKILENGVEVQENGPRWQEFADFLAAEHPVLWEKVKERGGTTWETQKAGQR